MSICSRHNPATPFPGYRVLSSSRKSDVSRSWCKLHTGAEINPNQLVLTQKEGVGDHTTTTSRQFWLCFKFTGAKISKILATAGTLLLKSNFTSYFLS